MCNTVAGGVFGIFGGILQGIGAAQQRETNAQTYEMNAAGIDRDIAVEKEQSAFGLCGKRFGTQR
jgi:hypothetical protein